MTSVCANPTGALALLYVRDVLDRPPCRRSNVGWRLTQVAGWCTWCKWFLMHQRNIQRSSDFDGERANAGLAATRLIQSAGMTWEQVLRPAIAAPKPQNTSAASPQPKRRDQAALALLLTNCWPECWADVVQAIWSTDRYADVMDCWEIQFISSLRRYIHTPSVKQLARLRELAEKVAGCSL
jgi:hypothetical protein